MSVIPKATMPVQENTDHVLTVQDKSCHNVRIPSDLYPCEITAICVLSDGQVMVADSFNKNVKLLDLQYRVVSHYGFPETPLDICQISGCDVAVAVDGPIIHEVQYITVNRSQLVTSNKLQFQHRCTGIAYHQGELYVNTKTALYKYTLNGKLITKLYEDITDKYGVYRFALCPTGDRLFITIPHQQKLLTLARDGTLLATCTDHELRDPLGVHVTPTNQVLVCGHVSNTIIQVDSMGRKKLHTLAKDELSCPLSVCYNSKTTSVIVGQEYSNNLIVFNVQCTCIGDLK